MKRIILVLCLSLCLAPQLLQSQIIYSIPGGSGGSFLFQHQGGSSTFLSTGFTEHNFVAVSRDSRFVVFSSPDPVTAPLQVPPSSDIYIFDRVLGQTRKVVDNTTGIQQNVPTPGSIQTQTFRPLSAALSPNNQFLAYGLELTLREGTANPQTGRVLIVASPVNGATISSPTDAIGGPLPDSSGSEFRGLSWDPGGGSFVTPVRSLPTQLPAIRRVSHNGSGQWIVGANLSTPVNNGTSVQTQIYPAISPSGTRLAYFDVFTSSFNGSVQARLVTANASDGSGAQILVTLPSLLYPTGLAWSSDGTQLVFGYSQQILLPGGSVYTIEPPNPNTARVRQIPSGGGTVTPVPGIGDTNAFFPSVSVTPLVSDQYYQQADAMYAYFVSIGDQNSGLAYWFYYRAFGDRALRQAQGYYALAQKEFYLGLAYFYYTYLTGSSASYFYYLYIGYSELTYYLALGDNANASAFFNYYYALALSVF